MDPRYSDLLSRLYAARRAGVVLGLERVTCVLDGLGNPERRLGAVIHIGGTNGKGSTAALVASMARAGGARVAVYSSPHLSSLRERIRIDGDLASEAALVAAADAVAAAGGDTLTFFEQVTAIAFVVMAQARPDLTVLEVGLGGRLDATNVVAAAVAVITGIALDHQEILGDSIAAIAAEKAGIFKPGQRVVIGASGDAAATALLREHAERAGVAATTVVDEAATARVPAALGLLGQHQRRNAAAALAALDALAASGGPIVDDGARARGLAVARHPGRLEIVAESPRLILDGAHNPDGAQALRAALEAVAPRPRVAVLGVSQGKDVAAMIAALAPALDRVIATAYRQDRALPAAALATAARAAGLDVTESGSVEAAIARARDLAGSTGSVVVAGSLMLVGEARAALLGGPVDPIAVSDPSAIAR